MNQIVIPKLNNSKSGIIQNLQFVQTNSTGKTYIFGLKIIDGNKYQYINHIVCSAHESDFAYLTKHFPQIDCFFISDLTSEENEELIKEINISKPNEYFFFKA